MGIPFYLSFDIYTIFISIFCEPTVYYKVFLQRKLKSAFWDPLWVDTKDMILMESRLEKMIHEEVDYNKIMGSLKGIKLKCTVGEDLFESISLLNNGFRSEKEGTDF